MTARCERTPAGMIGPRDRGAAVVDFVLILLLLIPLFLGIFQVGLVLYTRNTATACASEGARYGANFDRTPATGSNARSSASRRRCRRSGRRT